MTLPAPNACPGHSEAVEPCLECDTGVWAVGTLSGTVYVLDLERMTQTRWPETLGEPMVMVVDVVGDGVTYTIRQTNLVVEVRKLDAASAVVAEG